MKEFRLVYPMFVMALLSASVLVALFRTRARAVRDRKISPRFFQIYQGEVEPEQSAKLARHFSNLFEAPTLFYVVCLAAMVTQTASSGMLILAWVYVAARLIHAGVHLGPNILQLRIAAYFSSWAVLMAMWIWLAVSVAATS